VTSPPEHPQAADEQRTVAGRYLLERPVGRGGMGTVWLAYDRKLDRRVAIKEVRYPEAVSEEERQLLEQRTLREARSAARFSSPRTTTVHDVVDEGGRPWIVMEYVESRTLGELVSAHGPLPPVDVARIGLDLLDALEAAHKVDVVHRDVKPGNVLLDGTGRAWLTDFGIATSVGDETLSDQGVLLGSPSFMAPERARGENAGPFADLWSLGATLYAAVEGRGPFDRGEPMATLLAVTVEPPTPPERANGLTPVLLGLLAKEPTERMTGWQAREALQAAVRQAGSVPASAFPASDTSAQQPDMAPPPQASAPPPNQPPPSAPPSQPPPGFADTGPDRVHRIDRDEVARLAGLAGRSLAKGAAKAAVAGLSAWQESGSDGTHRSRRHAAAAGVRETASEFSRAYRASGSASESGEQQRPGPVAEPAPKRSKQVEAERARPVYRPFRKPLIILGLIGTGLVLGIALLVTLLVLAAR
jgi:serine/threonine protein kinase